jgi:hypothetical protein
MSSANLSTTANATIRLHPNPVTDFFQISGVSEAALLIIRDFNHFVLLKKQISVDEYIAVDMLKRGVYLAEIITSTETVERKLVKV